MKKNALLFITLILTITASAQQIGDGLAPVISNYTGAINSGVYSGINHIGGIPDTSYSWNHLFVIRHGNPNNVFQLQIASSYTENDRLFFRKTIDAENPAWVELATRGANTFIGDQNVIGNLDIFNNNNKISGFGDKDNYYIGSFEVPGSAGLDIHYHGGIRFGDRTSNSVMQIKDGNVGIGTNLPTARLQINNGDNSYGTILATATENQFSLYSKTLSTQPVNVESFRLGLKYNNDENNGFISFYRGMSTSGGFMGFSTNGIERIRIASNGNVGIGTGSPQGLLDIQKTISNAGGQSVVNIIGSTWAGDGASIVLNQLWNDLSYKTIIDNFSGNIGQTGSGLKVQTSYWNGSNVETITSLTLTPGGNLGIGITNPQNKLDVKGTIHSQEVKVDMLNWSDFVFKKEYNLPTLTDVEKHINMKGHLENIPSEEEVLKNGINLGEMNAKLLQKIEELTLYMIEQNKKNEKQSFEIESSKKQIDILKKENESFKAVFEKLSKIEQKINQQ